MVLNFVAGGCLLLIALFCEVAPGVSTVLAQDAELTDAAIPEGLSDDVFEFDESQEPLGEANQTAAENEQLRDTGQSSEDGAFRFAGEGDTRPAGSSYLCA